MADFEQIEQVMGEISTNVTIVTTKSGDKVNGLTLMWVSQVSFEPPQLMISIRKDTYTHELIDNGKCFAVNFLDEESVELARYFGSVSGRDEDKFAEVAYSTIQTGAPVLENAVAYLDCKVTATLDVGDHTIYVGEVVEGELLRDEKLLRYDKDQFFG